MYKLSVCIYLNHVPFDARQKSYEFKSSVKFGSCQKKSKSEYVGRFLNFMYKSIDFKAEFGVKISDFHNLSLT